MIFSSPTFFLFFLIYFCFHLIVPARFRIFLIICGGTIFYAWWRIEYAWVPYLLMGIAYGGLVLVERAESLSGRKALAVATIVVLFLPLVIFKYTDFLYRDVLGPLFHWHGQILGLPLPLGISFMTFTLTAYVVDTYLGKFQGSQRPSNVLGYVLFFPSMSAGPILRPHDLIPQLDRPQPAIHWPLAVPIAIFTVGLVKKLVFADQIAEVVGSVYGSNAAITNGPLALLAIYGFAVQIYCDFSGYTDMAIGLALMLGVQLPENFLQPYAATSVVDFWRRWHITLSCWLRDYLYIPLGGNRYGRLKEMRNIMITMVLGGLWHGASWTFVIWGLLHGVGVAIAHLVKNVFMLKFLRAIPKWLAVLITFHFVTFAWVFFRAPSLGKAREVLAGPFVGGWDSLSSFFASNVFVLLLVAIFFAAHRFDDHQRIKAAVRYVRAEILWPVLVLLWVLAITVSQGNSARFVYFDF